MVMKMVMSSENLTDLLLRQILVNNFIHWDQNPRTKVSILDQNFRSYKHDDLLFWVAGKSNCHKELLSIMYDDFEIFLYIVLDLPLFISRIK